MLVNIILFLSIIFFFLPICLLNLAPRTHSNTLWSICVCLFSAFDIVECKKHWQMQLFITLSLFLHDHFQFLSLYFVGLCCCCCCCFLSISFEHRAHTRQWVCWCARNVWAALAAMQTAIDGNHLVVLFAQQIVRNIRSYVVFNCWMIAVRPLALAHALVPHLFNLRMHQIVQ